MTNFENTLNKYIKDAFINNSSHFVYGDIVGGDKASRGSCIIKNGLTSCEKSSKYPFYNIVEVDSNNWVIEMALAGYTKDNITVSLEEGHLVVSGKQTEEEKNYVHRGIALRSFKKSFQLMEWHVKIGRASCRERV